MYRTWSFVSTPDRGRAGRDHSGRILKEVAVLDAAIGIHGSKRRFALADCGPDPVNRRTEAAYDRWASTYDRDPNPQTSLESEDILHLLRIASESRVLDAACGTGRYFGPMIRTGGRVTGFDLADGMLARARAAYPEVSIVRADLAGSLPYRDASFSHALCAQALKHLPSLGETFTELARILQPPGRLVFSVTHPEMDFTDYELNFVPSVVLSREADIHHHTEQTYREALAATGFVVEKWRAVLVSTKIEHLLTPESFQKVRGRPQVLVVSAIRRP